MDIINISSLYMYQEKLALEQDVKRRLQEIQNLQDQVKAGEVTLAYFYSFIWILKKLSSGSKKTKTMM